MKRKIIFMSLLLVVLLAGAVLTGCDGPTLPGEYQGDPANIPTVGEGDITFRLEVTDPDGDVTAWYVRTNYDNVGDALLAVNLIAGDYFAGGMGLLVVSANGIIADFNADGAWWGVYVDGEMSAVGVSGITPEDGITVALVYSVG